VEIIKGGLMISDESIIGVALKAGEELLVYAEGNPAQTVAVGVAAAAVVVAVGVGYGAYCGAEKLLEWVFDG
jgi:hypothetical protein